MIPFEEIWKTNETVIIHKKGKCNVIFARFNLMGSCSGYTKFCSANGGTHSFRNDGYGTEWWCQPIIRLTKKQWDEIPDNYKGQWDEWIREKGLQPDLPDEYIGKKTVFEGCITDHSGTALLTEGIHFIIKN